jgi:tetratricopeptide (TPR) repeat protein
MIALIALKQYHKAIECFDKVIELDTKNFDASQKKVDMMIALKKIDQIECDDKSIDLNKTFIKLWKNKGIALENLEQFNEAKECYDKIIELYQSDFDAFQKKNNVLKKDSTRCNEAIECYDETIDLN